MLIKTLEILKKVNHHLFQIHFLNSLRKLETCSSSASSLNKQSRGTEREFNQIKAEIAYRDRSRLKMLKLVTKFSADYVCTLEK